MIFWTVVAFVLYSLIYFVASQRKLKRMRNTILQLRRQNLQEKTMRPTRIRQY